MSNRVEQVKKIQAAAALALQEKAQRKRAGLAQKEVLSESVVLHKKKRCKCC